MAISEVRYRIKNADGKYWAYSSNFNTNGKSFKSKHSLLHEFARFRGAKSIGPFVVEETTLGVVSQTNSDLITDYGVSVAVTLLEKKFPTAVLKFFKSNGGSFGDYTHMIILRRYQEGLKAIERFTECGFTPRSYKKNDGVIYTKDDKLVTFAELSMTNLNQKLPAVVDLRVMMADIEKQKEVAMEIAKKW